MNRVRIWLIGFHSAWGLLTLASDCLAGTPREKAMAAVAVARAMTQLANQKPRLPDSPNRSVIPKPREAHEATEGREAPRAVPMSITFPKQAIINEILPAQLVIGAWPRGCFVCDKLERDIFKILAPLGWSIGHSATDQIRLTHVPTTEAVPQIILFQNGNELRRWEGYQDVASLSHELRKAWDEAPIPESHVAATGAGGVILAKSQIAQFLSTWRRYIGEGRQARFNWDRTGATTFPLLAKGDWSVKAIFGEAGRMELNAPGAERLPIDAFGFAYRIIGPDVIFDADPITFPGLATRLGPSQATETGPPQLVDPLTAWSIFSMVREIWQLLWPTCDLQLAGTVSGTAILNDKMLAIDFKDAPVVKLVFLFTFPLKIKRVEITDQSVRVLFSGSRFVKERTFSVN